jgi:hypothetical protein
MSRVSTSLDAFELKYRWLNGLMSLEEVMKLTSGTDVVLLSVDDYRVEGILWDALGEQDSAGPRNKILNRAYWSLIRSRDLHKVDIGMHLVGFAERARIGAGVKVPPGLAQVVASMMPRDRVDSWARAVSRPELLGLDW